MATRYVICNRALLIQARDTRVKIDVRSLTHLLLDRYFAAEGWTVVWAKKRPELKHNVCDVFAEP